jgi:5-formyltetrahydrofolate cyclo-ligase
MAAHTKRDFKTEKTALRQRIRSARRALSPDERAKASHSVCLHLQNWHMLKQDRRCIATYLATLREVSVDEWIEHCLEVGMDVAAPTDHGFARLEMPRGGLTAVPCDARGLRVPGEAGVFIAEINIFIVPGLAFDGRGGRLGQGGGWYDRLLAERSPEALVVGVCYDEELLTEVPREPHDQTVDYVVTPTHLIECDKP